MDDLPNLILDVLKRGELMSLATLGAGGVWVCDLVSVPDDSLNLYWISKETARHSLAVASSPSIAASISLHSEPAGVQISGKGEKITANPIIIREIHAKQGRAEITTLGEGEQMYKLIPERFELTNLLKFGFTKQVYKL